MSYSENEVEPRIYARQAENAPPWSIHLKTVGQMIADTQSLLDSIDAKATAADVTHPNTDPRVCAHCGGAICR